MPSNDTPKTPSINEMLERLVDKMDEIAKRLDVVENKQKVTADSGGGHIVEREFGADRPPREEREYAKAPWEEEIWVIALVDCTYPNPPELSNKADMACNYGIYRRAGKPEQPAIPFRLKHREHLHKNLKVLNKDQVATYKETAGSEALVPMTNARNVRETRVPV